jgi:hypothetical protein
LYKVVAKAMVLLLVSEPQSAFSGSTSSWAAEAWR